MTSNQEAVSSGSSHLHFIFSIPSKPVIAMSSSRIINAFRLGRQGILGREWTTKRLFSVTAGNQSVAATSESTKQQQREFILTEKIGEKKNVGLITLNRPTVLNALSEQLLSELGEAVKEFQNDTGIGALIITGNGKAFAAGADIKGMQNTKFHEVFGKRRLVWQDIADSTKPIIAAVNGYALGGGCEIAMMCDIIYASELAKFGQPEILIGAIPGAGGTQRLVHAVGKSKAMEICLTGMQITAKEAERIGLISKVLPPEQLLPETLKLAEKISAQSKILVAMCKEAVNNTFEQTLNEGLHFERRLQQLTFATKDQREGMTAFVEKRAPKFQDE